MMMIMIKRVDDLYVRQRVIKATAFSSRWGDTISIMLVVSSPRRIIAKITLICFRFTGNKTRMAAVKLIAPTWVSIDIPAPSPSAGQWLQRKDIKCTFTKPCFSHSVLAWLMGWWMGKFITVSKETQYRFNVKLWPTAWGCDWGLGLGEPVPDYTTSMFCCCYTYIAISKIDLDLDIFFKLYIWEFLSQQFVAAVNVPATQL